MPSTVDHGNVRNQDTSFKCTSDSNSSDGCERHVSVQSVTTASHTRTTYNEKERKKYEKNNEENVTSNTSNGDSCSSSCDCSCDSSSSFSSSASCISTSSSISSSISASTSSHKGSSSTHTSTVSSSPCNNCDSDSSTIMSDHECKSENSCLDDQCDHISSVTASAAAAATSVSACKSASPSFCSCCCESEQIATTSQHQLVTCEANIADVGMYDEIEDAFKLLESPCEKGDSESSVKKITCTCMSSPCTNACQSDLHTSWRISKSNWLKQSTFTINGTQAIFYLKLLHDSHGCESNEKLTHDVVTSPTSSTCESHHEEETMSSRSIDTQR